MTRAISEKCLTIEANNVIIINNDNVINYDNKGLSIEFNQS